MKEREKNGRIKENGRNGVFIFYTKMAEMTSSSFEEKMAEQKKMREKMAKWRLHLLFSLASSSSIFTLQLLSLNIKIEEQNCSGVHKMAVGGDERENGTYQN